MSRKFLAYLFVVLATLCSLLVLMQTPALLVTVFRLVISNAKASFDWGLLIGQLIAWVTSVTIAFLFLFFGLKWMTPQQKEIE